MNNSDKLTSAYAMADNLNQRLMSAEMEVSTLNDKVARLSFLIEDYKEQLSIHLRVTEAALLDRGMYKQHAADLATELEEHHNLVGWLGAEFSLLLEEHNKLTGDVDKWYKENSSNE